MFKLSQLVTFYLFNEKNLCTFKLDLVYNAEDVHLVTKLGGF